MLPSLEEASGEVGHPSLDPEAGGPLVREVFGVAPQAALLFKSRILLRDLLPRLEAFRRR